MIQITGWRLQIQNWELYKDRYFAFARVSTQFKQLRPTKLSGLPRGRRQAFFLARFFPEGDVGLEVFHHFGELV